MIKLQKIIDAGFASKPKMSWPTYDGGTLDRSKFVTSSEVWNCPRRIKFEKLWSAENGSLPFPNWGYAERGNLIEEWTVTMLRAGGMKLEYAGKDQRSFYVGNQSGTPDGMVKRNTGWWMHEYKSIDPRTAIRNLPKPAHIAQIQQNMDLVSHCLDVGFAGGTLFYTDASNLQKTQQYDVDVDHAFAQSLQERAEGIMAASSPADLPSEGMHTGDCDRCAFTAECSRIVAGDVSGLQKVGQNVFKHG